MTYAILEIHRSDDDDSKPWASTLVLNPTVIPEQGGQVVIRSPHEGDHTAQTLKVHTVMPLVSLDGYRVTFALYSESNDPLHLFERSLRRDLLALGWDVAPARPIDPAVDIDDYDGLEAF